MRLNKPNKLCYCASLRAPLRHSRIRPRPLQSCVWTSSHQQHSAHPFMRALDTDVEAEEGVSRSFCLSFSLSQFSHLNINPYIRGSLLTPRHPACVTFLLGFFKRSVARDVKPPGEPSAGGALSEGAHRHRAESTESDPNPAIPDRHTRAPVGGSSG